MSSVISATITTVMEIKDEIEMSEKALTALLKSVLEDFYEERIKPEFDALRQEMEEFKQETNARFEKVERDIQNVKEDLQNVKKDMKDMKEQIKNLRKDISQAVGKIGYMNETLAGQPLENYLEKRMKSYHIYNNLVAMKNGKRKGQADYLVFFEENGEKKIAIVEVKTTLGEGAKNEAFETIKKIYHNMNILYHLYKKKDEQGKKSEYVQDKVKFPEGYEDYKTLPKEGWIVYFFKHLEKAAMPVVHDDIGIPIRYFKWKYGDATLVEETPTKSS